VRIDIDIFPERVIVEGVAIVRPSGISVKQWMDQWDAMVEVPDEQCYRDEIAKLKRELRAEKRRPQPQSTKYLVTDIDHTISDAAWRDHLLGRWEEYYPLGAEDKVIQATAEIIRHFHLAGATTVAVTARPRRWEQLTTTWLYRNDLPVDEVLMREDDDHRPSCYVKADLVRTRFPDLGRVALVLEDDGNCCTTYRGMGLNVLQVERAPPRNSALQSR